MYTINLMVKPLIVLRAIFDETRKRKKVKNKKNRKMEKMLVHIIFLRNPNGNSQNLACLDRYERFGENLKNLAKFGGPLMIMYFPLFHFILYYFKDRSYHLTLSYMTKFRLSQTERVCRRQ